MARKRAATSTGYQPHTIANEAWGVLFIALGVLVSVALISRFAAGNRNILGPYLGRDLSNGLVLLFGPVASFVLPAGVAFIGVERIRNRMPEVRILMLWVVLTVELCILLAIRNLPQAKDLGLNFGRAISGNVIGNAVVYYLLRPVFGRYRFGPYFLFSVGFFITLLFGLRVNIRAVVSAIQTVTTAVWKGMRQGWTWLDTAVRSMLSRRTKMADTAPKKSRRSRPKILAPDDTPVPEKGVAEQSLPAPPPVDENPVGKNDESKKRLEEELAAFRSRKGSPVQITTVETGPDPLDGEVLDEIDESGRSVVSPPRGKGAKKAGPANDKPLKPLSSYKIPAADILPDPPLSAQRIDRESIDRMSLLLEKTLMNFGIEGKVVSVSPGPVITRYEIELAPGIKVSRVVGLQDDISLAVGGQRIRIQAPIPGKSAIGIELPNPDRQVVHFKPILVSEGFRKTSARLPVIIGRNISGQAYIADITKMPHLLISGQTGSGKSVCINSFICSLLFTRTPEELRLIMIDPKKVELAFYEGIPHLLAPVVTESKEAVKALQWAVREMERRYRMLHKVGSRDIGSFNARIRAKKIKEGILTENENHPLPFIVILVDELADLMMTASKDVEGLIQRIAQLARAVGLHLIVATQRPSVDIITGPIKANLTSRIAFRTIQATDSRTILGHVGSEKLLGMGDMLFLRNGAPDIERFHGSFISEEEVEIIVQNIRNQNVEVEVLETFDKPDGGGDGDGFFDGAERDELFAEAAGIVVHLGQGSTSLLQRRLKIGYARAGRLMDELEQAAIVGPQEGSKMREVLMTPDELADLLAGMQ